MANVSKSIGYLKTRYSQELTQVITLLLSKPQANRELLTVYEVLGRIGHRLVVELANTYTYCDSLRTELAREVQNGRLFRLVVKLGFINERPEYKGNPAWSETENRYLLKLFRDFVFHQVDGKGDANVDFGHVVDCLNQLDAGTQEKILLMSRSQKNIIVASYADMKAVIDEAFLELQGKTPMQMQRVRESNSTLLVSQNY
jgi:PAB-dependent poly(A)-specific ribonuclease subunit 3